jgi:hypothetical protein
MALSQHSFKYLFFSRGSTILLDPGLLTYRRFLKLFRHMVGLLGRLISPSQGLYLHRTTQHRKTRDKHPYLERDSNPGFNQPTGQDPRLRPHGHCDRPFKCLPNCNSTSYIKKLSHSRIDFVLAGNRQARISKDFIFKVSDFTGRRQP